MVKENYRCVEEVGRYQIGYRIYKWKEEIVTGPEFYRRLKKRNNAEEEKQIKHFQEMSGDE